MGSQVSTFAHKCVRRVKEAALNITRQILPQIVQYVVEHPIQAAFHAINVVALVTPGIVAAPLLAMAGFTGGGVAAGTLRYAQPHR